MDERNVILEIRAGTGGDEAALFAGNLFRMYERYAANQGWKVEIMTASEGSMGGYKEIIAEIRGRGAFAKLKYESGVHRVQRVPDTEASGRIHTSTATVAVLPEAQDVDVAINDADLKIDTLRSSGAGGQHVNKTKSAVRVTHIPSGIVVMMQEDRSQHRNRAKAMAVLRTRLYDLERQKQDAARAAERRGQVGTGDRSERIRTYNYPQGRVSDHRINLTLYKLPQILEGEALGEIIDALVAENQAALLAAEETELMPAVDAAAVVTKSDGTDTRTVAAARRAWRQNFAPRGIDSPELDARILVGHALGLDHAALAAAADAPAWRGRGKRDRRAGAASPRRTSRSRASSGTRNSGACRCASMPRHWCRGRRPKPSSRLRSPRSTCEARARGRCASPISAPAAARSCWRCLTELPNAFGVGTDVSPAALAVARGNARRLGLTRAQPLSPATWRRRCADRSTSIVSNPPYIASGDIAALAPEVRDFDPRLALDGGPDGLDFYRAIAAAAPALLAPDGVLVVELGIGQAEPVAALFAAAGLAPSPPQPDLNGMPRALVA